MAAAALLEGTVLNPCQDNYHEYYDYYYPKGSIITIILTNTIIVTFSIILQIVLLILTCS